MLRRSFLQAALACVPFSAVFASAINDRKLTAESLRSLTKEIFDNEPDRLDTSYDGRGRDWEHVCNEINGYFPGITTSQLREKFIEVKLVVISIDKRRVAVERKSEKWFYVYVGMARLAMNEIISKKLVDTNRLISEPVKGKFSKGKFYSFPPVQKVSPYVRLTDKDLAQ